MSDKKPYAPKWALSEIERLEKEADYWCRKWAEVVDVKIKDGEAVDTFLASHDGDRPLGRHARVRFKVDDEPHLYTYEVRLDEHSGALLIHSTETVAVLPRASNTVAVKAIDREELRMRD